MRRSRGGNGARLAASLLGWALSCCADPSPAPDTGSDSGPRDSADATVHSGRDSGQSDAAADADAAAADLDSGDSPDASGDGAMGADSGTDVDAAFGTDVVAGDAGSDPDTGVDPDAGVAPPDPLVVHFDPTSRTDYPVALDKAPGSVFVLMLTGTGSSGARWRLERRQELDLSLDSSFGNAGAIDLGAAPRTGGGGALAVHGSVLFVAIQALESTQSVLRIERRDVNSGALDLSFGDQGAAVDRDPSRTIAPVALAAWGSALYLGAGQYEYPRPLDLESSWRVEKRDAATGAPIAAFGQGGALVLSFGGGSNALGGLATDGAALYLAGHAQTDAGAHGVRYEKRNAADGALDPGFGVQGVLHGAEDLDRESTSLAIVSDPASGALYTIGSERADGIGAAGRGWRIERRSAATGQPDPAFGAGGAITSAAAPNVIGWPGALALEAGILHVSGLDATGCAPRWRIERRSAATGAADERFGPSGARHAGGDVRPGGHVLIVVSSGIVVVGGFDGGGQGGRVRLERHGQPSLPPAPFTLSSPPAGALVGARPVLSWTGAPRAAVYVVELDDETSFALPRTVTATLSAASSSFVVPPGALRPGATYHWRARARNAAGDTPAGGGPRRLDTRAEHASWLAIGTGARGPSALGLHAGALFVAGEEQPRGLIGTRWRVERRDPSTGALDASFGAAGAVSSDPSMNQDRPLALAFDGASFFAGGQQYARGGRELRVEKRAVATGALDAAFGTGGAITSPASTGDAAVEGLAVAGGALYLAGWQGRSGDLELRLERRDAATGALDPAFDRDGRIIADWGPGDDLALGVLVAAGSVYAYGASSLNMQNGWHVEKRSMSGGLDTGFGVQGRLRVELTAGNERVEAMVTDQTDFWIAGTDPSPGGGDTAWRVQKHRLSDGAAVTQFGTAGVVVSNPGPGADSVAGMSFDPVRGLLYLFGTEIAGCPPQDLWRVEILDAGDGHLVDRFTVELTEQLDPAAAIALGPGALFLAGNLGFPSSEAFAPWAIMGLPR